MGIANEMKGYIKIELDHIAKSKSQNERIQHALDLVICIGALYMDKLTRDEKVDHEILEHAMDILTGTVTQKHRATREVECKFVIPYYLNKAFKEELVTEEKD